MEKTNPSIDDILKLAIRKKASDIHLKVGLIPVIRRHGVLYPLSAEHSKITVQNMKEMCDVVMNSKQKDQFNQDKTIDLSYGIPKLGRFRINVSVQRGTIRMVLRSIPDSVHTLEDLNLPPAIKKIASLERGLVLLTGATGSGKSSTLAAMLNHINQTKSRHIITIEDPIEYLLKDRKSIITQREVGADTHNFTSALRTALRQDPDVILIGEMRDPETIEIALLAAETGHLVLSTLHTLDAQETVNRILSSFDSQKQNYMRMQLAAVLRAVVSQRLARRKDGSGFIPAVEILINNSRVKALIEDEKRTSEIVQALEEGQVTRGTQTFDQSLMILVRNELISLEEALSLSTKPEDFYVRYKGVSKQKDETLPTVYREKLEKSWANLEDVELEDLEDLDDTGMRPPPISKKRRRA